MMNSLSRIAAMAGMAALLAACDRPDRGVVHLEQRIASRERAHGVLERMLEEEIRSLRSGLAGESAARLSAEASLEALLSAIGEEMEEAGRETVEMEAKLEEIRQGCINRYEGALIPLSRALRGDVDPTPFCLHSETEDYLRVASSLESSQIGMAANRLLKAHLTESLEPRQADGGKR